MNKTAIIILIIVMAANGIVLGVYLSEDTTDKEYKANVEKHFGTLGRRLLETFLWPAIIWNSALVMVFLHRHRSFKVKMESMKIVKHSKRDIHLNNIFILVYFLGLLTIPAGAESRCNRF
jgi:hypothetical protein